MKNSYVLTEPLIWREKLSPLIVLLVIELMEVKLVLTLTDDNWILGGGIKIFFTLLLMVVVMVK
jgi:hypothetical protein